MNSSHDLPVLVSCMHGSSPEHAELIRTERQRKRKLQTITMFCPTGICHTQGALNQESSIMMYQNNVAASDMKCHSSYHAISKHMQRNMTHQTASGVKLQMPNNWCQSKATVHAWLATAQPELCGWHNPSFEPCPHPVSLPNPFEHQL